MGLISAFKEGRAAAASKREYAACHRKRQDSLLSFRKTAILELMFKYPDANLLLNNLDRNFMVLLKDRGGLLFGGFEDDSYPQLDYISDTASTSERWEAVARFRNALEFAKFSPKGFAIKASTEARYLIGGALFLNGTQIAKANVWDPKPKGYFSKKIFEEVLQSGDSRAGMQTLIFVTGDFDFAESRKVNYVIHFDRSLQYFNESNRKEFAGAILNLRDFLCDVEEYFRPESN